MAGRLQNSASRPSARTASLCPAIPSAGGCVKTSSPRPRATCWLRA
ncbi:MAG: hypothetical protein MZV64_10260 [Ignavibacteriales bacterium]|nr:hypothetical protein [Ignavibacteriales bacterium]